MDANNKNENAVKTIFFNEKKFSQLDFIVSFKNNEYSLFTKTIEYITESEAIDLASILDVWNQLNEIENEIDKILQFKKYIKQKGVSLFDMILIKNKTNQENNNEFKRFGTDIMNVNDDYWLFFGEFVMIALLHLAIEFIEYKKKSLPPL